MPVYNHEEGYFYHYDMMPEMDWEYLAYLPTPKGRFFTDEELSSIYMIAHRLTPENIELMRDWDRKHHQIDRFEKRYSGYGVFENGDISEATEEYENERRVILRFLSGGMRFIDFDFIYFKEMMYKKYLELQEKDNKDNQDRKKNNSLLTKLKENIIYKLLAGVIAGFNRSLPHSRSIPRLTTVRFR